MCIVFLAAYINKCSMESQYSLLQYFHFAFLYNSNLNEVISIVMIYAYFSISESPNCSSRMQLWILSVAIKYTNKSKFYSFWVTW